MSAQVLPTTGSRHFSLCFRLEEGWECVARTEAEPGDGVAHCSVVC